VLRKRLRIFPQKAEPAFVAQCGDFCQCASIKNAAAENLLKPDLTLLRVEATNRDPSVVALHRVAGKAPYGEEYLGRPIGQL